MGEGVPLHHLTLMVAGHQGDQRMEWHQSVKLEEVMGVRMVMLNILAVSKRVTTIGTIVSRGAIRTREVTIGGIVSITLTMMETDAVVVTMGIMGTDEETRAAMSLDTETIGGAGGAVMGQMIETTDGAESAEEVDVTREEMDQVAEDMVAQDVEMMTETDVTVDAEVAQVTGVHHQVPEEGPMLHHYLVPPEYKA